MKQVFDPKLISTEKDNIDSENILSIDESNAQLNLQIILDKFDIEIQKEQFDSIIKILNEISNYQQFQYSYYQTTKYRFFRPSEKIGSSSNATIQWWQYAIRMVVKQIKYMKGNLNIFQIPEKTLKNYENIFKDVFPRYFLSLEKEKEKEKEKISGEDMIKLQKVVETVEMKDLYLWLKPCLQVIYEEQKHKKKSEIGKFFSKFLKKDEKKQVEISEEEKKQIEDLVEKVISEEMMMINNTGNQTKVKLIVMLEEGSFKFSRAYKTKNETEI